MKIEVDYEKLAEEYTEIELRDGSTLKMKKVLPFKQKEQLAIDLANYIMIGDEEAGACYPKYIRDAIEAYLVLKYYSDLETEEYSIEYVEKVADWMCTQGLTVYALTRETDFSWVDSMVTYITDGVSAHIHGVNSLQGQIGRIIQSITGEKGLVDEMAKSTELNEQMISMIGAAMAQNRRGKGKAGKIVDLPETLNLAKK